MHSNVTIKNVSWLHFSWPTLYIRVQLYELASSTRFGQFQQFGKKTELMWEHCPPQLPSQKKILHVV